MEAGRIETGMATVRKTIELTQQQDAWITAQIAAGHDINESEVIRDLIRREQERSFETQTIRLALIEGEQSVDPEGFDFAAFKQRKTAQWADTLNCLKGPDAEQLTF